MPRRTVEEERPAVNRGLLTILVIAAVSAAGYWGYRYMTHDPNEDLGPMANESWFLYCSACKETFELKGREAMGRRREGRNIECPKCKQLTGTWGKPTETPDGAVLP